MGRRSCGAAQLLLPGALLPDLQLCTLLVTLPRTAVHLQVSSAMSITREMSRQLSRLIGFKKPLAASYSEHKLHGECSAAGLLPVIQRLQSYNTTTLQELPHVSSAPRGSGLTQHFWDKNTCTGTTPGELRPQTTLGWTRNLHSNNLAAWHNLELFSEEKEVTAPRPAAKRLLRQGRGIVLPPQPRGHGGSDTSYCCSNPHPARSTGG